MEPPVPYYKRLFDTLARDDEATKRAASQLLAVRRQLTKEVPRRTVSDTLLLATWNLREFGRNQKYGTRLPESIQCIAEIVSRFDLVAVQEVHQNLADLKKLMGVLGEWWSYIVTGVSAGTPGNQERTAFLYDTRKVKFDHLAGEVILAGRKREKITQPARGPFICAFRAGWRRISLCTVHIYYGTKDPNDPERVKEIDSIAQFLADRNTKRQDSADGEPDNVILLGDFNAFHQEGDKTTEALERHDFVIPAEIRKLVRDKYYDQIAFHDPKRLLRTTAKAGAFDFSRSIFRPDHANDYATEMKRQIPNLYTKNKDKKKLFNQWRSFQISDHLPLWIELKIDFTDGYVASRGGLVRRRKASRKGKR
jgi:endonuclease/exonuclease/phosphatase family metal-dependent hydrolase